MATNLILKRWIVVSVSEKGWVPHPATKLFLSEVDAEAGAISIVADGLASKSGLCVKPVELSEII